MKKILLALFVLPILLIGSSNMVKAGATTGYDYEVVGKSDNAEIYQGSRVILWVKIKNTGTKPWYNSEIPDGKDGGLIYLICKPTSSSTPGECPFYTEGNWLKPGTLRRMDESVVLPGQTGSFGFYATPAVNLSPGEYRLNLVPNVGEVDSSNILADKGISWTIRVLPKIQTTEIYAAEVVGPKEIILGMKDLDQLCSDEENQQATTLLTLGENKNINVDCGKYLQTREVQVKFDVKNIGNVLWRRNEGFPIHIATFVPRDRYSLIYHNSWLGFNRPAAIDGDNIANGGNTSISFKVKVPNTLSSGQSELIESFWLVAEGKQWFTNTGLMDVRIVSQTSGYGTNEVYGCTDNNANNYNANATKDDSSCKYDSNDEDIDVEDEDNDLDIDEDDGENIDINEDDGDDVDFDEDNGEDVDFSSTKEEEINL